MFENPDLTTYFERLDLEEPAAISEVVQASAHPMAHLLLSLDLAEPDTLEDTLIRVYLHIRQHAEPFDPSSHASFASWLYRLALKDLPVLNTHPDRKEIKKRIPGILAGPVHNLTAVEVAEVLQLREQRAARLIESSEAALPEEAVQERLTVDPMRISSAVAAARPAPATGSGPFRWKFESLRETTLALALIAVLLFIILRFNRSTQADQGIDIFNRGPEALPEVSSPTEYTVQHTITPGTRPDEYFSSQNPVISDDGRYVVFASNLPDLVPDDDNGAFDIFVYEVSTGRVVRISDGLTGAAAGADSLQAAISADGSRVVFATQSPVTGSGLHLADWQEGRLTPILLPESGVDMLDLFNPAISGDGNTAAFWAVTGQTTTCDGEPPRPCFDLFVYDDRTGETHRVPVGRPFADNLDTISISHDGDRIALTLYQGDAARGDTRADDEAEAAVLEWRSGEYIVLDTTVEGALRPGGSAFPVISADGRTAAYLAFNADQDDDGAPDSYDIRVKDLPTGAVRIANLTPSGAPAPLSTWSMMFGQGAQLDMSADGNLVVFIASDARMLTNNRAEFCVDLDTNRCFGVFLYDHGTDRTAQLDVSPILQAGGGNPVLLQPTISAGGARIAVNRADWNFSPPCGPGGCLAVWTLSPEDGSAALATRPAGKPFSNDLTDAWRLRSSVPGGRSWANDIAFNPTGEVIAAARQDGTVQTARPNDDLTPVVVLSDREAFNAASFSPDGRLLAAGNKGGEVFILDMESGAVAARLGKHPGVLFSLAFSPDGDRLAVGTLRELWIWRLTRTGWVLDDTFVQPQVEALAFTPDGRFLAASSGAEIWIRLISTGEVLARLGGHTDAVLDLAIFRSPEGETILVSGSKDLRANVWQLDSSGGNVQAEYVLTLGHTDWVSALAASPDGRILAAGAWDSTIHFWSTLDFSAPARLYASSQDQILSLAFSPDGRWLAAGTVRGVRLWESGEPASDAVRSTRYFTFSAGESHSVKAEYLANWFTTENVVLARFGSIAEAERSSDMEFAAIDPIPEPLTLESVGVYRDQNGMTLGVVQSFVVTTFLGPARISTFETTQDLRMVDWPIDPSASVFVIEVRGRPAEYVHGGWGYPFSESNSGGTRPWSVNAGSVFIRWSENGRQYSVYLDQPFSRAAQTADGDLNLNDILEIIETAWLGTDD